MNVGTDDGTTSPRRPRQGRRLSLSRERVVDAALDLVDEHGVEALSMRRLARDLDVEAMTLYHHVPNKAAIVDALVERVVAEFRLPDAHPDPRSDWRGELRATAVSAYGVLSRHQWAPRLMLATREPGPERLRYMDATLGTLGRAGFSPTVADHAYHALEGHIMGFSLWVSGMNLGTPHDMEALGRAFLQRLPAETYPHVAAHVRHHLAPPQPGDEGSFAFALDMLLDGLERLLAAEVG